MTIYLHIGTHKTGSKSFQAMLHENQDKLKTLGYDLYIGSGNNPTNHTELHLAALRQDRDSFTTHKFPRLVRDYSYQQDVKARVREFLMSTAITHQIFSSENLSYLRYPDEFLRLRSLFDTGSEIHVLVALRNKQDFMRSYAGQITKWPGRIPSDNPSSALYVGADSWLMDYEALVAGFKRYFSASISVIDYDLSVNLDGTVLPSLLRAMGIDPECVSGADRFINRS